MTRLDELKRKLAARQGIHAYRDSIPLIEAEITRLEQKPSTPPKE